MRKLATATAISLVLATSSAKALILGEIDMHSALNQPMDAEITLSSVTRGELDNVIVQLASADAFARAGIERARVLTSLQFNVIEGRNGQPVIHITSKEPVQEPFLNFLLEVDWPRGRMVREYTVLLDPPVFMTPTAQTRNTSADTPTVLDTDLEDSLLTPVAIERSDTVEPLVVDVFDESSVVVGGALEEVDDNTVVGDSPSIAGELVSLDELSVVSMTEVGTEVDDALSLSDVEVAVVQDFDIEVFDGSGSAEAEWDIAVVGDTREVADNVGGEFVSTDGLVVQDMTGSEFGSSADSAGGNTVRVGKNDTLWELASQNRVGNLSTQQMMLALLEANQQAFINGNINLVKAGSILRIPTAAEIGSLSQAQAIAQVQEQEQLWIEYRNSVRGVRAGTATRVASTSTTAEPDAISDTDITEDSLSPAAREILEQAQQELKLVADDSSTSTVASATADETLAPEEARLGEINRQLQLTREELAATRLEGEDLEDESAQLEAVTENMDQLVALQDNQLANLKQQLEKAREQENLAQSAEDTMDQISNSAETAAGDLADATAAGLQNAGEAAGDLAGDAVAGLDAAGDAIGDAASDATGLADDLVAGMDVDPDGDAGLQEVELLRELDQDPGLTADVTQPAADTSAEAQTAATTPLPAPRKVEPWWKQLLGYVGAVLSPKVLAGGLGVLLAGIAGLVLLRKRKNNVDDYDLDDVTLLTDEDGDLIPEGASGVDDLPDEFADEIGDAHGSSAKGTGTAAAAAVAGGLAASELDATEIDADQSSMIDDIDSDDTLSEADVFLAYGLHGQAEELLRGAVDSNPDSSDYRFKLMQCYHGQGKSAAFDKEAQVYFDKFGGAASPQWAEVKQMAGELELSTPLYSRDEEELANLGVGSFEDGAKIDDDDIADLSTGGSVASETRAFEDSSSNEPVSTEADIESYFSEMGSSAQATTDAAADVDVPAADTVLEDLTDSVDPGLAFDESDFEATGDFTQLSSELNAESDDTELDAMGSIGSGFDDMTDGLGDEIAQDLTQGTSDLVAETGDQLAEFGDDLSDGAQSLADQAEDLVTGDDSADGSLEFDMGDLGGDLGANLDDGMNNVGQELAADSSISELGDFSEDMSLDMDQLTPDMDQGQNQVTELMDTGMDLTQDLEIPDLTSNTDLSADASDAYGNADDMDTMMDLAKAYIDMGDNDSASSALGEIVKSGNPQQRSEAETLLRKIS